MVKYDVSRVDRSLLDRMAEALVVSTHVEFRLIEDIREAATVKLRSKAEVDADIAKAVRDYVKELGKAYNCTAIDLKFNGHCDALGMTFPEAIEQLLGEETSD